MDGLQGELRASRKALEMGDVKHAAHHAAGAISLAPTSEDALALIDHLIAVPAPGLGGAVARLFGSRDIAPLFPDDGFAGNLGARARAHWRNGELQEAFDLSCQLAFQLDDVPWVQWCLDIVDEAETNGTLLDPGAYLTAYSQIAPGTMGLLHLAPAERAYFAPWARLGQALLATDDGAKRPQLRLATSSILRRSGDFEAAIRALGDAADDEDWMLATPRGLALRGLGRWNEAVAAFERGMASSGDERTYSYEIARVRCDQGDIEEALRWFERGAPLENEEKLAVELLHERLDPSSTPKWTLVLGHEARYDDVRRLTLGDALSPPMSDASTNVLWQLEGEPPLDVRLGTSCLESASALACVALRTVGEPRPEALDYAYSETPSPHPFDVLDGARGVRLWEPSGDLVRQVIGPPSMEVSRLLSDLVTSLWYHDGERAPMMGLWRAWRTAVGLPGVDDLQAEDLLSAMIHPPRPEHWPDVVTWVFDRQVVGAMLLAAQDMGRPWLASRGRENLLGLLLGHPDWTQAAALVALRHRVLEQPEALEDAREWCAFLLDRQPDRGHIPWARPLHALYCVPGMPRREAARIQGLDEHGDGTEG